MLVRDELAVPVPGTCVILAPITINIDHPAPIVSSVIVTFTGPAVFSTIAIMGNAKVGKPVALVRPPIKSKRANVIAVVMPSAIAVKKRST